METGKIFAIGDIHGCYSRLRALLDRLPCEPERDTLVFLGDYINRGPQSRQVVSHLHGLRQEGAKAVFLVGNHEYLLLEYHRTGDERLIPILRQLGIESTLESYGVSDMRGLSDLSFMPPEHRAFLEDLLPYWETDRFIFVHGGITPGPSLEEQPLEALCETRDLFIKSESDFGKVVVFGHTPFELPLVSPNKIGIDTGAVYGNLLTAVELPGLRFYHA